MLYFKEARTQILLIEATFKNKSFRKVFSTASVTSISLVAGLLFSADTSKVEQPLNTVQASTASNTSTNASTNTSIRADGTILRKGIPFFPFGFYHDSDTSPQWFTTKGNRLGALRTIAAAGFNTIYPSLGDIDQDVDITFLNEAQRLGVGVIVGFPFENLQQKIKVISRHKNHPAIFGWGIADDFNWPDNKLTPGMIRQRNLEIKSADPNNFTYISGASALPKYNDYFSSADIIAAQSYPVGLDIDGSGVPIQKPLRRNYYWMRLATHNDRNQLYKKPIVANLQTFPWPGSSVPTAKQVRNMTYVAILNGVKGVIYYTSYYGPDGKYREWNLFKDTALWNGMKSLATEVNTLSPILLNSQPIRINTQADNLFATKWRHRNQTFVVIVNTSQTKKIDASVPLSTQVSGKAQPLFRGRPSGMSLSNNKLKGKINPGDVHVYKLNSGN